MDRGLLCRWTSLPLVTHMEPTLGESLERRPQVSLHLALSHFLQMQVMGKHSSRLVAREGETLVTELEVFFLKIPDLLIPSSS
jgi:hypothetical protein